MKRFKYVRFYIETVQQDYNLIIEQYDLIISAIKEEIKTDPERKSLLILVKKEKENFINKFNK